MNTSSDSGSALTREAIVGALSALSEELGKQGVIGELCLFGGTVTDGAGSDIPDILFLIRHLGLKNARAVLELVGHYYPENRIPMRAQYLVEGLFEEGKL